MGIPEREHRVAVRAGRIRTLAPVGQPAIDVTHPELLQQPQIELVVADHRKLLVVQPDLVVHRPKIEDRDRHHPVDLHEVDQPGTAQFGPVPESVVLHVVGTDEAFEHDVGADRHGLLIAMSPQICLGLLQEAGLPGIVVVMDHHELADRVRQPQIAGGFHAVRDRIVDDAQASLQIVRVAGQHLVDRIAGAGVVDHHQLPVGGGLGEHVLDGPVEHRGSVTGAHDDRCRRFDVRRRRQAEARGSRPHIRAEPPDGCDGLQRFRRFVMALQVGGHPIPPLGRCSQSSVSYRLQMFALGPGPGHNLIQQIREHLGLAAGL
ncbi:hypothetical protein SDC9_105632 [bioreactor metagenome]|uniref:Uncharacterized protein n=1 Tax=bioreactor metagenome TaxID=1076179 RepID=A0A645B086_9ZZZZ